MSNQGIYVYHDVLTLLVVLHAKIIRLFIRYLWYQVPKVGHVCHSACLNFLSAYFLYVYGIKLDMLVILHA
jgi:hypothetical protein